jgi:hypothetical protein
MKKNTMKEIKLYSKLENAIPGNDLGNLVSMVKSLTGNLGLLQLTET